MEGKNFVEGTFVNGVPLMPILIRNSNIGKSTIINLLIDSGAQHTLISKEILVDKLYFKQSDRIAERLIQGIIPKEECSVYCPEFLVDLFISRSWLRNVGVVAFDTSDDGILGRNVLQSFNIELKFLKNVIIFQNK